MQLSYPRWLQWFINKISRGVNLIMLTSMEWLEEGVCLSYSVAVWRNILPNSKGCSPGFLENAPAQLSTVPSNPKTTPLGSATVYHHRRVCVGNSSFLGKTQPGDLNIVIILPAWPSLFLPLGCHKFTTAPPFLFRSEIKLWTGDVGCVPLMDLIKSQLS